MAARDPLLVKTVPKRRIALSQVGPAPWVRVYSLVTWLAKRTLHSLSWRIETSSSSRKRAGMSMLQIGKALTISKAMSHRGGCMNMGHGSFKNQRRQSAKERWETQT